MAIRDPRGPGLLLAIACALAPGSTGCADDGTAPPGLQLVARRDLANPSFTPHLPDRQLLFQTTSARAEDPTAPADLRVVPIAGGPDRILLAGYAPRWGRIFTQGGATLHALRDERASLVADGSGGFERIGTYGAIDFTTGAADEVPDVKSWELGGAGALLYSSLPGGNGPAQLHLRVGVGADDDHLLAQAAAGERMWGAHVYFVAGEERTLYRVPIPANGEHLPEPESMMADVQVFGLRQDERWAIVRGATGEPGPLFALDLERRMPTLLPGEAVCCLLGFLPDGDFLYAEAPSTDGPARLHRWTFADDAPGTHAAFDLPAPDFGAPRSGTVRPGSSELLLWDAEGRMVIFDGAATPAVRPLGRKGLAPAFVGHGSHLAFLERNNDDEPVRNRLMLMDASALSAATPAHDLTPEGHSVGGYFTTGGGDGLAFWAYVAEEASDLFLADLATPGATRRLARGVGLVAMSGERAVGVVRVQPQDRTGDLVHIDVATGAEHVYARGVRDFALARACEDCGSFDPGAHLAFLVHRRTPSIHDGLWATTLE